MGKEFFFKIAAASPMPELPPMTMIFSAIAFIGLITKRSRGRPRLPATDDNLLRAAYKELEENGYRGFSMEKVARRAGASKATLYRRWSSAADLLLEALVRQSSRIVPLRHTGKLEADLKALLMDSFKRLNGSTGQLVRSLMAEAQLDDAFKAKFRDTFIFARRAGARSILENAVSAGRLSTDLDREFTLDLIFGVMWYRLLLSHAALDEKCAIQLVNLLEPRR